MCFILLTGCAERYDEDYYINYSNTVVSFFRTDTYDSTSIYDEDIEALKTYLTTLTHEDELINIDEYVRTDEETSLEDSSIVLIEDNKCYIRYDDLKKVFDEYNNSLVGGEVIEAYFSGVCNSHPFVIYESNILPPYEETIENPRYNYILLKDKKGKNEYIFYYQSTYDGTGLQVTLKLKKKHIIDIQTDFINVDGIVQGED